VSENIMLEGKLGPKEDEKHKYGEENYVTRSAIICIIHLMIMALH
jgi:hypothetical protein